MSSTVAQARLSVQKLFNTGWASQTPVAYDNRPFDPKPDEAWVRLSMLHADGGQVSLGGGIKNSFRRIGIISAQVFVPKNSGTETSDGYVQDIFNIFDGKNTSPENVIFREGSAREVGVDGVWFVNIVTFEFHYDETK